MIDVGLRVVLAIDKTLNVRSESNSQNSNKSLVLGLSNKWNFLYKNFTSD